MNLEQTISLQAFGTSEGASKGWDVRGRGRTKTSTGETNQFLHKGFHETLNKLGYRFDGTYGEEKAGTPSSHYYHPTSQRSVDVSENGSWMTKKGDGFGPKTEGKAPGEFFEKYHMKKK